MCIEGEIVNDQNRIADHVVSYFETLFTGSAENNTDLDLLDFLIPTLVSENQAQAWEIIASDIVKAVWEFFNYGVVPPGLNSSFLVLIPKKDKALRVEDYRPIALSNFLFKIFTMILATRLNLVAATFVTNHQYGFIHGRKIHDAIILASEGVNTLNRTHEGRNMALKFKCSQGVRQGDPLSPILFGIAEEVLSYLILRAVDNKKLIPMSYGRGVLFPMHIIYADDVFLFCQASKRNVKTLSKILEYYASLSGQVCSKAKSRVFYGKGVQTTVKTDLSYKLGFTIVGHYEFCYSFDDGVSLAGFFGVRFRSGSSGSWYFLFKELNKGLLMKLAWGVMTSNTHAMSVIRSRYLPHPRQSRQVAFSSIWPGVRSLTQDLVRESYCIIGDGSTVDFWHDNWLGYVIANRLKTPLCLHGGFMDKVGDFLINGIWTFTESFVRAFLELVTDILQVHIVLGEDERVWTKSLHGLVTAKLTRLHTREHFPTIKWGKWIWDSAIPVRRSMTNWRLLLSRLPTFDTLHGFIGPGICVMCRGDLETLDHLFWHCPLVGIVWRWVFDNF
ncbi:hypothetical protein C2S53_002087 [Perilla frutescens var. hirtella]|uniref:Reverse transcriptase domain-containing protein n=1 Tax=Perilla frutescens var. hirtella TaxID=608512 RepID=A0AAD4JLP4_PERFH|nr:hypothetical protein C2S53_002087 [Perilla frutescens var. hirtella]